MLGDPHAVDRDDALRLHVHPRRRLDRRAAETALVDQFVPVGVAAEGHELVEADRVLRDEMVVEHARAALGLRAVVRLDHQLADAEQRGDVAARLHLMVLAGDLRLGAQDHVRRALRIGEPLPSALAQRVEGDDLDAPVAAVLQRVEHPRRVGADVLPKAEDRVALVVVGELDRRHRRPDRVLHADRGRLVAHVGRIGQVLLPPHPRHQRPHERRLQAGAAGRVEADLGRIARRQRGADRRERLVPARRDVFVGRAVVAHRRGQPAGLFQVVIHPAVELGHGVALEELGRDAVARQLPRGRLGAVLAELGEVRLGRLPPGARHAHEALGLVLAAQRIRQRQSRPLVRHDARHALHRSPSARRRGVGLDHDLFAGLFVAHSSLRSGVERRRAPAVPSLCGNQVHFCVADA